MIAISWFYRKKGETFFKIKNDSKLNQNLLLQWENNSVSGVKLVRCQIWPEYGNYVISKNECIHYAIT